MLAVCIRRSAVRLNGQASSKIGMAALNGRAHQQYFAIPNLSRCLATEATQNVSSRTKRAPPVAKKGGSIENVFATLSGGSLSDRLPDRFTEVKQSIIQSQSHSEAIQTAWKEVLESLKTETKEIEEKGASLIPQVTYPGDDVVDQKSLEEWMGKETIEAIKRRGSVIIKGVVPVEKALQWKQDIREYVKLNPQTKGFPEKDPMVYELYWSKPQLEARGHPSLLRTSRSILALFHAPGQKEGKMIEAASLQNVVSYCDRLRIRRGGDKAFALGPHIDGGGVERWEDPAFRSVWNSILQPNEQGKIAWKSHDSWSLGENGQRLEAQTSMYDGAGACSVFRPLQGWMSMSSTGAKEGTLRVLPILQSASAYIVLKPFFRFVKARKECANEEEFLDSANWRFDLSDSQFDGCVALGRNIELDTETHPHLKLDRTMTSIPRVEPGDCALWHCDQVHAVESEHEGLPGQDSSVMYIPAIPLTHQNFEYISYQRQSFEQGIPPPDFPGGEGESKHIGRGTPDDINDIVARRAMGLEPFEIRSEMSASERRLVEECNAQLA